VASCTGTDVVCFVLQYDAIPFDVKVAILTEIDAEDLAEFERLVIARLDSHRACAASGTAEASASPSPARGLEEEKVEPDASSEDADTSSTQPDCVVGGKSLRARSGPVDYTYKPKKVWWHAGP
jgi:hypothetical protein